MKEEEIKLSFDMWLLSSEEISNIVQLGTRILAKRASIKEQIAVETVLNKKEERRKRTTDWTQIDEILKKYYKKIRYVDMLKKISTNVSVETLHARAKKLGLIKKKNKPNPLFKKSDKVEKRSRLGEITSSDGTKESIG